MKLITILIACFIGTQSFAQQPMLKLDMGKVKSYIEKNYKKVMPENKLQALKLLSMNLNRSQSLTYQYSHSTPLGDVFLSSQDNMPCLMPDNPLFAVNMPCLYNRKNSLQQLQMVAPMPNLYRGKPLVLKK